MSEPKYKRGSRERGYSLAEILVAMAIFTAVILAALMVYDRSNKVFKTSVEASDMQQSTRVAFDRLVADIRMTGFDYDRDGTPFGSLAADWTALTTYTTGMLVQSKSPNGHTYICITGGKTAGTEPVWPTDSKATVTDGTVVWQENGTLQYQQPDEQIEFAGEHAIALRANFNYDSATGPCPTDDKTVPCENGREPKLESTPFPVVTTDNDEIIVYALKPVAWKSGESADDLVFYADTSIPRNANPQTDGKEDAITIAGVELCDNGCNSPPYTLYRYTLDENGDPDAGTPVADNIRSMSFRYFNTTSASADDELETYPNGEGQYDGSKPNETLAGRDDRSTIRAIELTLTGMNAQKDTKYTDTTDSVAPNYRKLTLKSLIVPRNIGRRGMKEYNTTEPGEPELKSVCAGSCNAVYLTWSAPSTGGDIDSYAILYDTDSCADLASGGFQYAEEIGLNIEGSIGRYIEPGQNWSFAVQAINKWGAKTSNCMEAFVVNRTKPAALSELNATHTSNAAPFEAVENAVELYFPAATANVAGQDDLTCTGGGSVTMGTMPPPEKRYYEILRAVDDPDFQPGGTGVDKVLDAGSTNQPVSTGSTMKWTDTAASNCTQYHYRIRVVDYCARDADMNNPVDVNQGISDYYPALDKDAIPGRPFTSKTPDAPTLLLKDKACDGNSDNCDLTLAWQPVTSNSADETIYVRQYVVRGYLWDASISDYKTDPAEVQSFYDGELTATVKTQNGEQWKFVVVAVDCNESDPSNAIIYPCEFKGGEVKPVISAGQFGGTGTDLDPYIVEAATLTVTTDSDVSEITATAFLVETGAQIGDVQTKTGPLTTADFGIPELSDSNKLVKILITAKDEGGCTKNAEVYVRDEEAPLCSISDTATLSTLTKPGNRSLELSLVNTSDEPLTVLRVVATFTTGGSQKLNTITFDGITTDTVNCSLGDAKITPSVAQTIPADNELDPYKILLVFDKNVSTGTATLTSFCVTYRASTGDVLSCQMHPTAAACTEPSSTCE